MLHFLFLNNNFEHSHYQHERLATVVIALFLIEVLVDHLMDFFVSGSAVTQQTLVNSALVASAPLPCLPCFCTFTAALNCVRATDGLPADRAPVYRGCPCRDPVPTDTQAEWYQGQSANPLAAALLLHCTELHTCVRVRSTLDMLPQTHSRESRPIRLALCRTVHLQSELAGEGNFHIPCRTR